MCLQFFTNLWGCISCFQSGLQRLFTPDQKQQRVEDSERCLELFKRGKQDLLRRYVTMDEIWIHHYTPETKRSSAERTAAGKSRPKRPKNSTVGWQGYGIRILGCAWYFVYTTQACFSRLLTRVLQA